MRGNWIAATAIAALAVTACGSSSKADSSAAGGAATTTPAAAATTAAASTEAPATTTAATEAPVPTEAVVDDSASVNDTTATDDTVDTNFSGDGSGPFCDLVRKLDAEDPMTAAFDSTDPAQAKQLWSEISSTFATLADIAPDEIAPEVTMLGGAFQKMDQFFAKYNYDMKAAGTAMQTDTEMVALFSGDDQTMQNASDRLDAYGTKVCGLAS